MKKKIIGIFITALLIATSISVVGNGLESTLLYFDVGVGEPTNIHDGDYRSLGEDSFFVTVKNHGDLLASVELNFTLERLKNLIPIVILDEGFENPLFPPQDWLIHHDGNQHQWQHDTIIGHESSSCAGLFTIWPPTPPMIFDEWMVTESYNLSEAASLILSVWYYGHANAGVFTSNFEIWASTDGGTNPNDFLATGIMLKEINPLADEIWILESVDLSPLLGEEDVYFAFRFVGEEFDFIEFFIDDILIEGEEYDWDEIDSQSNGPYDLDPDVWIESFFDVFYDVEGEYRATFSLDTPLRSSWFDDNPNNDVYQAVFTVIANNPPDSPTIDGPVSGKPGIIYDYDFTNCVDPDGDDMTYHVEWGDGGIDEGFVESGGAFTLSHSWSEKGDYTIKAQLIDVYGAESDWATLEVTMPVNQQVINPLLQMIPERFPNAFPILAGFIERFIPKYPEKPEVAPEPPKEESKDEIPVSAPETPVEEPLKEEKPAEREKPEKTEEPDEQKDPQEEIPLELTLKLNEVYKEGDPIPVTATLTNIGDEIIMVSEMNFKTGTLDFYIDTPDGYKIHFIYPTNDSEMRYWELKPEESRCIDMDITTRGLFGISPSPSDCPYEFKEGGYTIVGYYKSYYVETATEVYCNIDVWDGELYSSAYEFTIVR